MISTAMLLHERVILELMYSSGTKDFIEKTGRP